MLDTVRERIARHQRENIGEKDTNAALIVPVLRALGWDVEDLEEVKLEYAVDRRTILSTMPSSCCEARACSSGRSR